MGELFILSLFFYSCTLDTVSLSSDGKLDGSVNKYCRSPLEMLYCVAILKNHSFRKLSTARHPIFSPRSRVGRAKGYWDIPQGLMISIDNSWGYIAYLPWRTSIQRMASDSVTLPKYAWVVLRSWCRRITLETISNGTPFRLA